jgi:hypothetical protein
MKPDGFSAIIDIIFFAIRIRDGEQRNAIFYILVVNLTVWGLYPLARKRFSGSISLFVIPLQVAYLRPVIMMLAV